MRNHHKFLIRDSKTQEEKRQKAQKRHEFKQMKKDFESGLSLDEPIIRDVEMKPERKEMRKGERRKMIKELRK